MPELPEVQCTVNFLDEKVRGRCIEGTTVLWDRSVAGISSELLKSQISGRTISSVSRRAKFIRIQLDSGATMYIHLRMSGVLDVIDSSWEHDKHDRVIFSLSGKKDLRFNDVRKFGKIYLSDSQEEFESRLGPEPLEMKDGELFSILQKSSSGIKSTLLNQARIAGLGNIYVDETLWKSGIHPLKKADSISRAKACMLMSVIKETLLEAISLDGTDNGDGVVIGGGYSPRIYGRTSSPCSLCRRSIRKITVGQRGTHFCPGCQRIR